jgi:replicative DNA helicase
LTSVKRSVDRLVSIPGHLEAARSANLNLGLPMVDEYLLGILPTDLVVLGAASGIGKTQALLECAKYNALGGKRVVFIALEAEQDEIEMRLKYQMLAQRYFGDPDRLRGDPYVSYRTWRLGLIDEKFQPYMADVLRLFETRYGTLSTVYSHEGFGLADFERLLASFDSNPPDLVIVDHLHYFDTDESKSENQQLSLIIKRIRQLNLFYKIPFIVAAHTRKGIESLVPSQEDFMGTSNIYKQATVCLMLAPKPDGYHAKRGVSETLMSVVKTRTGGMGNLCGELYFSIPNQAYSMQWSLGRLTKGRTKFEKLEEEEIPEWATGATKSTKT